MDLTTALADIVTPVVQHMLRPSEVTSIHLDRTRQGEIVLTLGTADTNPARFFLYQPGVEQTVDEARLVFADQLQDHIAESSFAWAELRTYPGLPR
ncbi:hypothetical protein [Mumia sp. Pv 4-285]|uniref:hypothetical protein n=1 Tax=Mumia qirimensis TaxID=3234852 RepID=UPI00351CE4A8